MSLIFESYFPEGFSFFQHNIYIAVALAGVLFLLLIRKTKFFLLLIRKTKLFSILVIIAVINISFLYGISYTSSLGVKQKQNLFQKSELHLRAH
jgi:hypothetical protein